GFAFVLAPQGTAQATPTSAAACHVNSAGDAGDVTPGNGVCATAGAVCTLRAAIDEATTLAGMDTINFNIPAGSAGCVGATNPVCTITPATAFTSINAQVTINGYTQPGASANTNPIASGSNAVLKIELNGTSAGAGTTGLIVNVGSLTSIRGLVINRFGGAGILVSGAGTHTVAGNYIGTNVTGTTDLA